jgi:hypothetical protein
MPSLRADSEIVLDHGGNAVILRPCLRAAAALERSHDGFDRLFQRIAEFHTGTVREIILTAATDRKDAARFLDTMSRLPISRFVEIAQASLARLVVGFFPQGDDKPAAPGKAVPWREAYRDFYRYATGWLHWSPDQAWNATPTEIVEAFAAHLDMLKAIHGPSENDESPEFQPDLDAKLDRDGLNKLRGKGRLV